ncbi:uncharacterized protein MYCFIDRAFT_206730 [Pseudocercospora fijiensis CIRAD86]|uniref:Uncharacterized protein n=1 Tax=Pseudocercospora fijiensis (strain CIRAD86) TaxID=383855 RepID=M3BA20_PSEFD|nr:uncharacterized protein MYCFIDRAFT_206730 [Pseudocercospora fijiensis CIRAD86]EME86172.1 hypothetical protein MYCFIDRAFT_206730 [Pseudocercospora fijiensis CIRAD86]
MRPLRVDLAAKELRTAAKLDADAQQINNNAHHYGDNMHLGFAAAAFFEDRAKADEASGTLSPAELEHAMWRVVSEARLMDKHTYTLHSNTAVL